MGKAHEVRSTGEKIARILIWVLLFVIAALTIFPVLYVVFGSLKENKELLRGGAVIFPQGRWAFDNYAKAWQQANFARYTANSLFISFGVMIISLINSSMAGYAFARRPTKFKEALYLVFVGFMFINVGSVSLRPLYELAVGVKMNTSLISVILISAGGAQATYIFLCRGFVASLPKELDEAATIDGCGFFRILLFIIVPSIKSAMIVVGLLKFIELWNDLLQQVTYITRRDRYTLALGLNIFRGSFNDDWSSIMCATCLSFIPGIVFYLIGHRYPPQGIVMTGMKN
ncbi:MAG: carbohydrate ABC transporter permease [Clostridia bacterium]|nr:carbohydrate ABC transporter permease [Clostridia bacterium]